METELEWIETKYIDKSGGKLYINKLGQIQKRFKIREPKLMKGSTDSQGYVRISVLENGKYIRKHIHSIMGEMFLPNPYNHRNIDHIDRNKTNNRLDNLRWFSQSNNMLNRDKIQGIYWIEDKNYWVAKASNKVIGYFHTEQEAYACKYGYLKALNITIEDV